MTTDGDGSVPERDLGDYDSGPFCRHWDDEACEIKCAACGHRCWHHVIGDPTNCEECDCKQWTESEELR